MSLDDYITDSSETMIKLGEGFQNDSAKPDTDWQNLDAMIELTRDEVKYPLTVTFINA